jgi:inner membrane transporter RhtA
MASKMASIVVGKMAGKPATGVAARARRRPGHRARCAGHAVGSRFGALPPPALILIGIISVQVGAGLAKQLFTVVPPVAVTLLRLWSSAAVLLAAGARTLWRSRHAASPAARAARPGVRWGSIGVATAFGLTLVAMNFAIYQSMARIPLGVAVTIEFLGPLALAVAASRRLVDLLWVALAGAGVALLTDAGRGGGQAGDPLAATGVAFALVAGAAWAAYIMLSTATGRRFRGSAGLMIAMVVAAVVITPVGAAAGGAALLRPRVLAIGAAIGLLSSVIPYSLELEALRRLPPRVFSILMSVEPAMAALVGLVLLGQVLTVRQWLAIGFVMVACIGATRD